MTIRKNSFPRDIPHSFKQTRNTVRRKNVRTEEKSSPAAHLARWIACCLLLWHGLDHQASVAAPIPDDVTLAEHPASQAATGITVEDELRELRLRISGLEARASATPSNPLPISFQISGQINRAIIVGHDGEDTEVFHVDNDSSSSRVRLIASAPAYAGFAAGGALEFDFRVNNSFTAGQSEAGQSQGGTNFRDRRVEVWMEHAAAGRVWIGKGWTATEFSAEQDLSGTGVAGYTGIGSIAGGMRFRDTSGFESNPRISDVFTSMDGLGRDVRLRYDTPAGSLGPVQLRTSIVQGGSDVAVFLNEQTRIGWIQAAIGYVIDTPDSRDHRHQTSGSLSFLAANGLNLTVAGGGRSGYRVSGDDRRGRYIYFKIGYRKDLWSLGASAISMDHMIAQDIAADGDRARALGLQAVQQIAAWNSEIYLGARRHTLERPGLSFDAILNVMLGVRLKF